VKTYIKPWAWKCPILMMAARVKPKASPRQTDPTRMPAKEPTAAFQVKKLIKLRDKAVQNKV